MRMYSFFLTIPLAYVDVVTSLSFVRDSTFSNAELAGYP